jgi:hypothetical protein
VPLPRMVTFISAEPVAGQAGQPPRDSHERPRHEDDGNARHGLEAAAEC